MPSAASHLKTGFFKYNIPGGTDKKHIQAKTHDFFFCVWYHTALLIYCMHFGCRTTYSRAVTTKHRRATAGEHVMCSSWYFVPGAWYCVVYSWLIRCSHYVMKKQTIMVRTSLSYCTSRNIAKKRCPAPLQSLHCVMHVMFIVLCAPCAVLCVWVVRVLCGNLCICRNFEYSGGFQ